MYCKSVNILFIFLWFSVLTRSSHLEIVCKGAVELPVSLPWPAGPNVLWRTLNNAWSLIIISQPWVHYILKTGFELWLWYTLPMVEYLCKAFVACIFVDVFSVVYELQQVLWLFAVWTVHCMPLHWSIPLPFYTRKMYIDSFGAFTPNTYPYCMQHTATQSHFPWACWKSLWDM